MIKKLVIIFLTLLPLVSTWHHHIVSREDNFYKRLHTFLQNAMNKVFLSMHLKNNFTWTSRNRLLLSMHASLKAIAERNYEIYKGIKKLCHLKSKRKSKQGLFNLDRLIKVLIDEKLAPSLTGPSGNETILRRTIKGNFKIASLEVPNDSEEALIFLKEYMNNVEGMEMIGVETPFQRIRDIYEKNKVRIVKRKKLKAWRPPNSTEHNKHKTRRVFHGKRVKIKRYPFLASIHIMGEFVCAGSIISNDMIITAATCLQLLFSNPTFISENPHGVVVRMGSDYTERFGEVYLIKAVFFHPKFSPETLAHNLAILQIEKRLLFRKRNKKIRRIEYVKMEGKLPDSVKEVLLLGWGDRDSEKTSQFDLLASAYLTISNIEQCMDIYSKKFVSDMNFCAGFIGKGAGACQRDIGGPAIVSNVLVGVVSFGPPVCGTPDAPTVFTSIGYYVDWIDSVLKGTPNNGAKRKISQKAVKNTMTSKLITTTTSQMPAVIRRTEQRMRMRFQTEHRNMKLVSDNKNKAPRKTIKTRSEYPKAVEVITYLLNEIIAGGEAGAVDDIMYNDDDDTDDDSDDFGTIITDDGPIAVNDYANSATNNHQALRMDAGRQENPFISMLNKFMTFGTTTVTPAIVRYERTFDPSITLFEEGFVPDPTPEITTLVALQNTNSANATNSSAADDPIFKALKALKGVLGINIMRLASNDNTTFSMYSKFSSSLKTTKAVMEERKLDNEDENDDSDNYESDDGMSIEIPTGLSYVSTAKTIATTPDEATPATHFEADAEVQKNTERYERPVTLLMEAETEKPELVGRQEMSSAVGQSQSQESQSKRPKPEELPSVRLTPVDSQSLESQSQRTTPVDSQSIELQSMPTELVGRQKLQQESKGQQPEEEETAESQSRESQSVRQKSRATRTFKLRPTRADPVAAKVMESHSLESHSIDQEPMQSRPMGSENVFREPMISKTPEWEPMERNPNKRKPIGLNSEEREKNVRETIEQQPHESVNAEGELVERKPVGRQSKGRQPTGRQPTGRQPTGRQPVERQPLEQQPMEREPAEHPPPVYPPSLGRQPIDRLSIAQQELAEQQMEQQAAGRQQMERQSKEWQPIDRPTIERQPMERRPVERQPIERQPMERQPMEQQTMERQSAERQSMEQQPTERQVNEQEPKERQSKGQQQMERQQIERQHMERQPVEREPMERQPMKREPMEQQPMEREPMEREPKERRLIERQQMERQPMERQLIERQPIERQPVKREPMKRQPKERQPMEQQTIERQPMERQIMEQQPIEREPKERETLEREPAEREPKQQERMERERVERQPVEQEPKERERMDRQPMEQQPTEKQPIERQATGPQPIEQQLMELDQMSLEPEGREPKGSAVAGHEQMGSEAAGEDSEDLVPVATQLMNLARSENDAPQPIERARPDIPRGMQEILRNNFVKTDKLSKESSEVVVLLLKGSTTPPKKRLKRLRKTFAPAKTTQETTRFRYPEDRNRYSKYNYDNKQSSYRRDFWEYIIVD